MNKNDMNIQDDKLKELLSGTRMKAGENLKFRIMQQIQTEAAFTRKKKASPNPLIGNMLSIFGVMYALIALVGVGVYFMGGRSALESALFFLPVIMIASVCGMFWMISAYDDKRRSRQKMKE